MKTQEQILSWLEDNKHRFAFPMVYQGDEINAELKPWDSVDVRVVVVGSSTYKNLGGNLAVPLLAKMMSSEKSFKVIADRSFLPSSRDEVKLFVKDGIPVFGLEHHRSIADYDIIAFSTSAMGDELNCMKMLSMSGIPVDSQDRLSDWKYPLIIRGGQAIWSPEPTAPAWDACFIGEAELIFNRVLKVIMDMKKAGKSKLEVLRELATKYQGIYVPSFYEPIYKDIGEYEIINEPKMLSAKGEAHAYESVDFPEMWGHKNRCSVPILIGWKKKYPELPDRIKKAPQVSKLEDGFLYTEQIVPYVDSGMSAGTVMVSRGCWAGCNFCNEGQTCLPYRELSLDVGIKAVKDAVRNSGARAGMLSAFCSSSYTNRKRMVKRFLEEVHDELGFISQRVDECFSDPDFVEMTRMGGNRTVSLGIEGVNQRLRDLVSKNCTEEQILGAAEHFIKAGYSKIKCFMMNNLPYERPEDYIEGLQLIPKLVALKEQYNSAVQIKYSFSPLIIVPFVPFQFAHTNVQKKTLETIINGQKDADGNVIQMGLKETEGIGFRIGTGGNFGEAHYSELCHLGDRRIYPILKSMVIDEDFLHFGATSRNIANRLDELLKSKGLSYDYFFREKVFEDVLPWEILDVGVSKRWLWSEYLKIKTAPANHTKCIDACRACGVCNKDDLERRTKLKEHWEKDNEVKSDSIKKIHQKGRVAKVRVKFDVDKIHRFMEPEYTIHVFRRACYLNDWPVIKDCVRLSSQSVKLYNYFYGTSYLDLEFFDKFADLENLPEFIKKISKHMVSGIKVLDAQLYWQDIPIIRSGADTCFYRTIVPFSIEDTLKGIEKFKASPKVDHEKLKYYNDPPKDVDARLKEFKQLKSAWLKDNTSVVKVQDIGFDGALVTELRDAKDFFVDAWASVENGNVVLYTILQQDVTPHHFIQSVFGLKKKASWALYAERIDYLDWDSYDQFQDSIFTVDCPVCGEKVFESIIHKPISKDGKCLKCEFSGK